MNERFFEKYLVGDGIDIGAGVDPVTNTCKIWEFTPDGDAQTMSTIPSESFDWVYSSHCLEHLWNPTEALANWWKILKPNGYLVISVPDEDLYEQGHWPLRFNGDHKSTWTIWKESSWSPVSHNLIDEIQLLPNSKIEVIRLCDDNYIYGINKYIDQSSAHWNAEVSIEVVVKKLGGT